MARNICTGVFYCVSKKNCVRQATLMGILQNQNVNSKLRCEPPQSAVIWQTSPSSNHNARHNVKKTIVGSISPTSRHDPGITMFRVHLRLHNAVRVLTELEFLPAIWAVPFGATRWHFLQVDTIKMKPFLFTLSFVSQNESHN